MSAVSSGARGRGVRVRDAVLTLLGLAVLAGGLYLIKGGSSIKFEQACALFTIWGIAAISLNLVNGTTGILSLGHHGFMLIGGYTTALLTLPELRRQQIAESARSQMNEFSLGLSLSNALSALGLDALTTPETLWFRFLLALIMGGLVAALFGLIVGIPSLRLRGDYLAIVTFGFGEIIRLLASTSLFAPFTNGSLGYTGVPAAMGRDLYWTFGILAFTVFVMVKLKYSSYGRALQGIREDEIAAEAMGVNLAYHKVLAFALSAFFAGVAGGLYASWLAGARLDYFLFTLTFFFLVAVSVGGTGSYTGVLIGTALVVFVRQYGDPLERVYGLNVWFGGLATVLLLAVVGAVILRASRRLRPRIPPILYVLGGLGGLGLIFAVVAPSLGLLTGTFQAFGMRAILLSVVLIAIMILRPSGILGSAEFSWAWLLRERRDQPSDEERKQDAWLSNPELNRSDSEDNRGRGEDR